MIANINPSLLKERTVMEKKLTAEQFIVNLFEHHFHVLDKILLGLQSGLTDQGWEQFAKLASNNIGWLSGMNGKAYDFDAFKDWNIDEIKQQYADGKAQLMDRVKSVVAEGRLGELFTDASCEPPRQFTYAGWLAHLLESQLGPREALTEQLLITSDPMHYKVFRSGTPEEAENHPEE